MEKGLPSSHPSVWTGLRLGKKTAGPELVSTEVLKKTNVKTK